jgi:expansin (peptidoglycan-binding protein)
VTWRKLGPGGAGAALAAVLGLAACGADPACAAPSHAAAAGHVAVAGKATFYDSAGMGNCMFEAPGDRLFVALGNAAYDAAAACGGYLDVTGPKGTVRVKVTDRCPECQPGHIDLSREAFTRIADPVRGIVPVTYRQVTDPPAKNLTFRVKEGASQYWFAVRVDNHGNPLRSVEAKAPGGSWRQTVRQDYNYWLVESGLGPGPYAVRVTDVRGRRATATGIDMRPGVVQQTSARMGGGGAAAPAPAPARSSATPSKKPTPKPSRTAGPTASATPTPPDGAAGLGGRTC